MGRFFLGVVALLFVGCNDTTLQSDPVPKAPGALQPDTDGVVFERTQVGDLSEVTITLRNTGEQALMLFKVRLPEGVPFELAPVAGHTEIAPEETLAISMRFLPTAPGLFESALSIESGDADNPLVEIPLQGPAFDLTSDDFVEGDPYPGGKADIAIFINDSWSMSGYRTNFVSSLKKFFAWLLASQVDFHIGIGTMSPGGKFHKGWMDRTMANATAEFAKRVDITCNTYQDKGYQAMENALSPPAINNGNKGFLRADARLMVVMISDSDDLSTKTPSEYIQFFQTLKPNPADARINGVFKQVGPRFAQGINATAGQTWSLSSDFSIDLEGLDFEYVQGLGIYKLAQDPISGTIQVFLEGVLLPEKDWGYDASSREVYLVDARGLATGTKVRVTYEVGAP